MMQKKMNVPLFELKTQYAKIRDEVRKAVDEVLESQYFIGGPAVDGLEKAVAQYEGVGYGVGVSSGTDALISSLMALGIYRSPLDSNPPVEVIVPAYTFFATAGCVWRVGARPIFVDIDPVTFNIDASKIEEKITERTKAIIPVHLFGQCAEMEKVMEIANRHGLHVVEDCAQSIGASRNGSFAGSFGDCGALSFFPTKNLGGLGDGGMVISNHKHVTDEVRRIRNHGMDPKYYHKSVGGNFRLDAIQAAALSVKLKYLDSWRDMRESNAKFYDSAFKGSDVITPKIIDGNKSVYNQYIVRVPKRDKVLAHLRELGVNCEIYYPVALHEQECFAPLGYAKGDFPESEKAAAESLALPIYPELSKEQLEYVANCVLKAVSEA